MRTQFSAVVRKETLQTVRDRRVMALLVVAPLMQTIVFGVAVDFDVDNVPVTVEDRAQTSDSRAVLRGMFADGTLRRAEAAETTLFIGPRGESAQLCIDGSDPIRAGAAAGAAAGYLSKSAVAPVRSRVLYNPQLKTRFYMVPGILGMLLVVVTTVVTAMGLAREKETGTLEQLAVTPIHPLVLLAGKMTPFVAIGLLDTLLVLVAHRLVVELKAVETLAPIHWAQTLSYLKTTQLPLALLINFNVPVLLRGVRRVIDSRL